MENEVKVVDAVETAVEEKEKKIDLKKVGKVIAGVGLGAAALGAAAWKYFSGKRGGSGYSDLPGGSSDSAPTANESDFAE